MQNMPSNLSEFEGILYCLVRLHAANMVQNIPEYGVSSGKEACMKYHGGGGFLKSTKRIL